MIRHVLSIFFLFALPTVLLAQDSTHSTTKLPFFKVQDLGGGRVIVGWENPFGEGLTQVSVQRSLDNKRFSTVYSAPSPELPANGFSDKVQPGYRYYYRIFYVLRGGAYYFSKNLQPGEVTLAETEVDTKRDKIDEEIKDEFADPSRIFSIKNRDSLYAELRGPQFKKFRDSILVYTKDTLISLDSTTVDWRLYIPPFTYGSSLFVFTDKDGYVNIKLPDASKNKYELRIMEEDETPVLNLKKITDAQLVLDKTNFYHAGWYKFELVENGRVKERNKFYIPKAY